MMSMKTYMTRRPHLLVAGAGILIASFGLISWAADRENGQHKAGQKQDTIPAKENTRYEKDFDKELRKLDDAQKQLDELKDKNWNKVQEDLQRAMKNMDVEKLHREAQQAMDKIDIDQIAEELETSISKIDFDKIEREIEAAGKEMSKIDKEKIKEELQRARNEIDEQMKTQHWREEMEKVKNIELKEINRAVEEVKKEIAKIEAELKTEKFDIKEALTGAHADLDKAREELKGYQEMVYGLEQDGLLNSWEDYKIEYKEGEVYVNGKKQLREVTNKYKKYFKKETVTIKKRNGDINIDND